MTMHPELRIGDFERDAAVSALGDHFAAGRLTRQEFDERSDRATQAKTGSQLNVLFADLPSLGAAPREGRPPNKAGSEGRPWLLRVPWMPVLLVLAALAAISHAPFVLLLVFGWLWFFGPMRNGWRPYRSHW